jgi:hypothetical protein
LVLLVATVALLLLVALIRLCALRAVGAILEKKKTCQSAAKRRDLGYESAKNHENKHYVKTSQLKIHEISSRLITSKI